MSLLQKGCNAQGIFAMYSGFSVPQWCSYCYRHIFSSLCFAPCEFRSLLVAFAKKWSLSFILLRLIRVRRYARSFGVDRFLYCTLGIPNGVGMRNATMNWAPGLSVLVLNVYTSKITSRVRAYSRHLEDGYEC